MWRLLVCGLCWPGSPSSPALSPALVVLVLFRLLTFWRPVPAGWVALKYLQRRQALWRLPPGCAENRAIAFRR
jgi:hypothetical protein